MSNTAVAMCVSGAALFVIGAVAAKKDFGEARGLDRIVALAAVCFAVPLAVFGALHLASPEFVVGIVPPYMPWRMLWAYLVGFALIAAALSIATRIGVGWSALLFGTMMFLFVAMIHLPGGLSRPDDRIIRTIVFREMAFGGGALALAGHALRDRAWGRKLVGIGAVFVALALFVFGVEHFRHPMGLPGVPLEKEMPAWVPGRVLIDYATGLALLVAGASILLNRKIRIVTAMVGGWLLLLVLVLYGPLMILALADPGVGVQVEGINYFADTLLFGGCILAVARAS